MVARLQRPADLDQQSGADDPPDPGKERRIVTSLCCGGCPGAASGSSGKAANSVRIWSTRRSAAAIWRVTRRSRSRKALT